MTITAPQVAQRAERRPVAESVLGPSAEVIPFPLCGQELLLGDICFQYCERRGRKQKRAYLDDYIASYRRRMERLGVARERIEVEVVYLESIVADDQDEKKRA